jgi:hypothetical protein
LFRHAGTTAADTKLMMISQHHNEALGLG